MKDNHVLGRYTAPAAPVQGEELRAAYRSFEALKTELAAAYQRIDELETALKAILAANDDFAAGMPSVWEGDLLQDACDDARKLLPLEPSPAESGA